MMELAASLLLVLVASRTSLRRVPWWETWNRLKSTRNTGR